MIRAVTLTILLVASFAVGGATRTIAGRVVDAASLQPIADAIVTSGDAVVRTGPDGAFEVPGYGERLGIRAYGYAREFVTTESLERAEGQVRLARLHPEALYLTSLGFANRSLRNAALAIAAHTEINALVIDVKGDRGYVAFASAAPLARASGAERSIAMRNLRELTDALHAQGLYVIARIVVFKDNVLATARPDLAVKTRDGRVWHDTEGLAWTDPMRPEVWDYNVALAVEAARAGFDEIQFDYVRFPDSAAGLVFSAASTQKSRIAAISGFLAMARERLVPYNVFLSADIFGYVCWNLDDSGIGQTLSEMLRYVDYLSPMLYPSTFQFGIPGYRDPVAHPYEVVYRSLERALARSRVSPLRLRPWLQSFRDYAFDRRAFTGEQIRTQILAADRAGTNGWMLWNPRNVYSDAGLASKAPVGQAETECGREQILRARRCRISLAEDVQPALEQDLR